jgi:hypothetical protein
MRFEVLTAVMMKNVCEIALCNIFPVYTVLCHRSFNFVDRANFTVLLFVCRKLSGVVKGG